MTDTTDQPKINNMAVCMPPRKGKDGAEILATFDVLMFPVHAKNMMLVRRGGQLKLWTSNTDLRFISTAREMIIAAAMETAREAIDSMGALDQLTE
jgi:hypothetical protein